MTTNGLITQFVLPDLVSNLPYPLHKGTRFEQAAIEAEEFVLNTLGYTGEKREALLNAKLREFVEFVFQIEDPICYRTALVYIVWAFSIDDWMDASKPGPARQHAQACFNVLLDPDLKPAMDDKMGNLTKGWMAPFAQRAHASVRRRLIHRMNLTLQAMGLEAEHRAIRHSPGIETYIKYRQETGGVMPGLCVSEFIGGFAVPEQVLKHPTVKSMEDAACRYIVLANDLFSYNKEVGEGHTYNLVLIVMKEKGYGLQEAVDYVGKLCGECIDTFEYNLKQLPSWDSETDEIVAKYVLAMQNCMSGTLHWSFSSERYFGKDGPEVKKHRIVKLHPNLIKQLNGLQNPIALGYMNQISRLIIKGKGFLGWLIHNVKSLVIGK